MVSHANGVVGWWRPHARREEFEKVTWEPLFVSELAHQEYAHRTSQQRLGKSVWPSLARLQLSLERGFLPAAFPSSVGPSFLSYCHWQFLQMAAGSASQVLSMQALLFAAGLGAGAIPMAAAMNWVLKDGLGQFGGVLYASLFGTQFDEDPKRQRFIATVGLQAACVLDIITPLVPALFLPLASLSNAGKNIAILTMSATRAQIHQNFALRDNLGDITGKITSQSIASSLVGTTVGVALAAAIGNDPWHVLGAFVPLSAIVVWANFKSSERVEMRTLNVQRAELALRAMLQGCAAPSPAHVALEERFVWLRKPSVFVVPLTVAASRDKAAVRGMIPSMADVCTQQGFVRRERYVLAVAAPATRVLLWYTSDAAAADHVRGLTHACALRALLADHTTHDPADSRALIRAAHQRADDLDAARSLVDAGWDLTTLHINPPDACVLQLEK